MAKATKAAADKNVDSAAATNADGAATEQLATAADQTTAAVTSQPVGESALQTEGSAVNGQEAQPNNPTLSEELAARGEQEAQESTAAELQSDGHADEIEGYWVRAVAPEGRRRAGFSIPQAGIGFGMGVLTDAQLDALRSDPHVVVQECVFSNSGPV